MGQTVTQSILLDVINCADCGISFALPDYLLHRLRNNGNSFYCPVGHSNVFKETEVMRLRAKLDEQTRIATQQAERALRAQQEKEVEIKARMVAERKLKRVNKGVCPCCNRTFQNLAKHMATKHAAVKS